MAEHRNSHSSFDSSQVTAMDSDHVVVLRSGRMFDLRRSRWDGVLDREEYEYCREHGVGLGYDCAQIGWVTQTCVDESSEPERPLTISDVAGQVSTLDPEERTFELRGVVEREASRILANVRDGRMPVDEAQQRLSLVAASVMKGFASRFGLADADLAHWVLESAAAKALASVRKPIQQPRAESERTAFAFRPWSPDDALVYTELLGNPRIWDYLPEPFPTEFTVDIARALIEVGAIGFHHDTQAIEAEDQPIGQCVLRFDRPFAGTRTAEVAYWLGEEHWGRGWMSRVLPAFTHRSFRQHPVDVIYAWISKDNEASIRVAARAGYRRFPSPLEAQLAASLGRPGFVRYVAHRIDWVDRDQAF